MVSKRKRTVQNGLETRSGLAAGQILKRNTLAGDITSPWGWAGTEVRSAAGITPEHRLATCRLSKRNKRTLCPNKYAPKDAAAPKAEASVSSSLGDEDMIDVDAIDDSTNCSKRTCKSNPFCLNYLGQDKWEDSGMCENSRVFHSLQFL